jgi:hypothetical protein
MDANTAESAGKVLIMESAAKHTIYEVLALVPVLQTT